MLLAFLSFLKTVLDFSILLKLEKIILHHYLYIYIYIYKIHYIYIYILKNKYILHIYTLHFFHVKLTIKCPTNN